MKTRPYHLLTLTLGIAAMASCTNSTKPTKIPVSTASRMITPIPSGSTPAASNRLFEAMNSYRLSKGVPQLQRHNGLDRLAQAHCEYLRKHRGSYTLHGKNVSHIGFQGRAMIARERFQMENVSENVAASKDPSRRSTESIMSLWKNSKDHHKNMLDDWTHTGMGVVVDSDGMIFATQIFSTVSYSQMMTRERFNRF